MIKLTFTPEIHFSRLLFMEVQQNNITFEQLKDYFEYLRVKAKETGYDWDNEHFYVNDICGQPALQIGFLSSNPLSLSFYNAKSKSYIKTFLVMPTSKEVETIIENVSYNNEYCDNCKSWKHKSKGKHFSYAGWVCNECYDPSKHLPPDSSD